MIFYLTIPLLFTVASSRHAPTTSFISAHTRSKSFSSNTFHSKRSVLSKLQNPIPKPAITSQLSRYARDSITSLSLSSYNVADHEEHAREIFSMIDTDESGTICEDELQRLLSALDIPASEDEVGALFKYLDLDGSGEISFKDEFCPWYLRVVSETSTAENEIRGAIIGRKTVSCFDRTKVSTNVLEKAIECALSAPKLSTAGVVPWRFLSVGDETLEEMLTFLKKENVAEDKGWESAPGWCVVTCPNNDENSFVTACCAIENFMLSMYAEDVGTRLLRGEFLKKKEFAELCCVDLGKDRIVACVLYGFATGGLGSIKEDDNEIGMDDALSFVK